MYSWGTARCTKVPTDQADRAHRTSEENRRSVCRACESIYSLVQHHRRCCITICPPRPNSVSSVSVASAHPSERNNRWKYIRNFERASSDVFVSRTKAPEHGAVWHDDALRSHWPVFVCVWLGPRRLMVGQWKTKLEHICGSFLSYFREIHISTYIYKILFRCYFNWNFKIL